MCVMVACKLLKPFPRYDKNIFMNVIVDDLSWMQYIESHRIISNLVWLTKYKKVLNCHKDYQSKKVMYAIFSLLWD